MTTSGPFGDKPQLMIVIASVRDGRAGKAVGDWFTQLAQEHGTFNVTVADLKELDLPLMTEPNHPRLRQYTQEKTKQWSAMVDAADAFVFVMPEYNFVATAPLINAIDYLVQEWAYKPVGLVSYGGVSGGLRAAQSIKPLITSMSMMPIKEGVTIQFVANQIDKETGAFHPIDSHTSSAETMLNSLRQWESTLRTMRAPIAAD
ncbi:MAG TPA: NAD(P)H-dependent oxidoreductase [Thermomicrobiales bacterium]|nr:NAD(P)H-dependent oxidoreductase [Thermomicrobiales bacterium]